MMNLFDKKVTDEQLIELLSNYRDVIVSMGNGEPNHILSTIDGHGQALGPTNIHQILEMKNRKYIQGAFPHIRYISYFLNGFARKSFNQGLCDLMPNHFHQVPRILEEVTDHPVILCQTSTIDSDGYVSLGTEADYTSHFIDRADFIVQMNKHVPFSNGDNKIHISQIKAFVEYDEPLHELPSIPVNEIDQKIASYIAERIDDGSTLQVGIGGIPNAVVGLLEHHQHLGIHTEMLTDGIHRLVEKGVITGNKKKTYKNEIIASFALGSKSLYDFMHLNNDIRMLAVNKVNDPRIIAQEDNIVSINATTEVDFYGQCASETIGGKYYSSTGGQADFSSGVRFAKNGKGFICLYSTAKNDTISRIKPILTPGSVVTTTKNDVDHVVTEYGIAKLNGKSIFERTKSLISIAHPKFREELQFEAKKMGYLI